MNLEYNISILCLSQLSSRVLLGSIRDLEACFAAYGAPKAETCPGVPRVCLFLTAPFTLSAVHSTQHANKYVTYSLLDCKRCSKARRLL